MAIFIESYTFNYQDFYNQSYKSKYYTNNQGLRFYGNNNFNDYKILVLGDSFTMDSYVGNDETLYLLRNHPNINNYIIEILLLWGANVDQKCITSYEKVVQYLLKYVLKHIFTL